MASSAFKSIIIAVSCIFLTPWAASDDAVILFGGLSYIDSETTPQMERYLTTREVGPDQDEGYALIDSTEALVAQLSGTNWLEDITTSPVLITSDDAWKAVMSRGADERRSGQLSTELDARFDTVYGLVLVGTFEDMIEQTLPITVESSAERVNTYVQTFMVGVDALLVEFDDSSGGYPIRLAGSSFVTQTLTFVENYDRSSASHIAARYRESYERAISEALTRLGSMSERQKNAGKEAGTYMVTGFAIQSEDAAQIFGYDLNQKPTGAELNSNICEIRNACEEGSSDCKKVGALLMHGLTSTLSEAGYSVLPPLKSAVLQDTSRSIRINLRIQSDEDSLFSGSQSIELRPSDASFKVVPVLRALGMEDIESKTHSARRIRNYVTQLGFVEAATGFDGCSTVGSISAASFEGPTLGCAQEPYLVSQGTPSSDLDRDLYTLSMINKFQSMSQEMTNGRQAKTPSCEGIYDAD